MLLLNNYVTVNTFLLLSLFGIISFSTLAAPIYNANYCPNNASYNSNQTFQTNLNVLLSSLVTNATEADGSYYTAMGMGTTNVANGQFLCRGDVSIATCQNCIATAATEITRRCPNQTESIIWYDQCMLRYTNRYFGPTSIVPGVRLSDDKNVSASDFNSFNQTLFRLLNGLAEDAASSQSAKKFATQEMEFAGSSQVYGLAQCVPDLTSVQCEECLRNAIGTFPTCCGGKQGARALLAWCNIRYELFPFYNTSGTSSLPPVSPPSSGNDNSVSRIILIVVLVVVSIIIFCCAGYFLVRRSRKNHRTLLRENLMLL